MYNLPEPWSVEIIYANNQLQQHPWQVPKRAKMLHVWACSGGGGGGGGCSGTANTLRGGGAGGSAGNLGWVMLPTIMCPDVLYFTIGQGGAGGGPDTDGTWGESTHVSFNTNPNGVQYSYIILSLAGNGGGGKGTNIAGGTAAGTGSGNSNVGFSFEDTGIDGPYIGGAGTVGTNGSQVSLYNCVISPGTGGAGSAATYTAADGGNYFVGWESQTFRSGGAGAAGGGGSGRDGTTQWNTHHPGAYMIKSIGGTGGGNANTGPGGNGGAGGIGSGGGGGGGGTTGGTGGKGGDGIAIISYW